MNKLNQYSWRWSFFINVPIGIACLILIIICFKIPTEKGSLMERIKRIDFAGTFTVVGKKSYIYIIFFFKKKIQ